MAPGVKISELKHRVAICTMKDVVLSADRMVLRREAVVWTWAKIEHQQHPSVQNGDRLFDSRTDNSRNASYSSS